MEIKYIRDLDHNYLVMKAERTDVMDDGGFCLQTSGRFAERMLCTHIPEGVIGFEIRSRNNAEHLFYKTDSLISLTNRTLTLKLSRQEMQGLLEALCLACEAIGEYLLDMGHLFLSADTVFTNPSTHQWFFICYPYAHEGEGTLETFLEELTSLVSSTDDDAVSEVFALCELAGRKNSRLREMLKELKRTYDVEVDCSAAACMGQDIGECEDESKMREQQDRRGTDSESYENDMQAESDFNRKYRDLYSERLSHNGDLYNEIKKRSRKAYRKNTNVQDDVTVAPSRAVENRRDKKTTQVCERNREKRSDRFENTSRTIEKRRDKSFLIIPLLFIVVFLVPVYIRKEYVLSEAANIACSVIMGLCAAGAVGSFLLERHAEGADDEEEADQGDDIYEDEVERNGAYQAENEIKGRGIRMDFSRSDSSFHDREERPSYKTYSDTHSNKTGIEEKKYTRRSNPKEYNPYSRFFNRYEQGDGDECTVLLTDNTVKRTPKLYGRNSAASTNILLEQLPLTLGSLGGSVDYKLSDRSVSRMHAYIGKNENGNIFLKDLGSTNGTYLNGKRLDSNEIRVLNCGDEVRFGTMEFEFI